MQAAHRESALYMFTPQPEMGINVLDKNKTGFLEAIT